MYYDFLMAEIKDNEDKALSPGMGSRDRTADVRDEQTTLTSRWCLCERRGCVCVLIPGGGLPCLLLG